MKKTFEPPSIAALPRLAQTMIEAAAGGRTPDAIAALALGADPNAMLDGGRTALMMACCNGHPETVAALAQATNPNHIDQHGDTALHLACAYGHGECVKALLSQPGYSILRERRNNQGRTPLLSASARGELRCIEPLIDGSQQFVRDDLGSDAAMLAASNGMSQALELLLSDCPPTNVDSSGGTALLRAADHSHLDCMVLCANAGADPFALDNAKRCALHRLAAESAVPMAVFSHWADYFEDLAAKELEAAKWLLSLGLDPAQPDHEGRTPIELACSNGSKHLALAFIDFAIAAQPGSAASLCRSAAFAATQSNRSELAEEIRALAFSAAEKQDIGESIPRPKSDGPRRGL